MSKTINIINNENYFTNNQLRDLMNMLDNKYLPSKLIICETKKDVLKLYKNIALYEYIILLLDITIWTERVEGMYLKQRDTIIIYMFSQNYVNDKLSKQLYSIHTLMHELRHVWQHRTGYKGNKENDADKFASKIVHQKSKKVSRIMNWKDEWEVEEE
jgi:Zn-dependent peptidase ImmA (M78 family)